MVPGRFSDGGDVMSLEQARKVKRGDRLGCVSETGEVQVTTVEQITASAWRPVEFLVRDEAGESRLVGYEMCSVA